MESIKKKLPNLQEIIPVYAVTASLLFGWMLVLFAWNLPSWIKFMPLGELLAVLSYAVSATFLQTLIFQALLLFFCILLPVAAFRRDFIVRGSLVAFVWLGLIFLRAFLKSTNPWFFANPASFILICAGLTVILACSISRLEMLQRGLAWVADRLIVFLYILVPLIVVSLLTILVRNLL